MKHCIVTFQPDGRQVSIHAGATLVEAAGQAGIVLNTVCGQKGTCRKCTVILQPRDQSVLACQYRITENITVLVPPDSRFVEHKILTEGVTHRQVAIPDIFQKYLTVAGGRPILGLAVDIGTTTVVVKLIDMATTATLATAAALNPQTRFGDDVISRIGYAKTDERLGELNKLIVDCLNKLIADCCTNAGTQNNDIYETCVVGNTTMNHIFLRLPITQLGVAPYKAFSVDAKDSRPGDLGLHVNPAGNVHTLANIAGFVGADTTAVALATALDSADEMTLAIDIGTNGEVVLGTKDKLYAASCAAGPAFEGARIVCGSRAVQGAVEAVVFAESDIDLDVVGGGSPVSICGSGIIDAVAVLLDSGIIDSTGRFNDSITPKTRIAEINLQSAFVLACDDKGKPSVYLTQKDIREVQLAKAAIRAGIRLLQNRLSVADADIKKIFLAGAFGNYIRRQSALRIGLLPDVPIECIQSIGNAASAGAQMALLSSHWREIAADLARKIQYVEIAHDPLFQSTFADSMLF
ncbi:MAG: ASKHA domain-containing protein [Sedimentisphaerales bacterium]|jgi:uncharacterized 2Fe-2S/4Fe-4S cluster protein (DUF4445 family)